MRWQEIIIGSSVTLVVTVLAGLLVFYLTKEPEIENTEKLQYELSDPVSFVGTEYQFSIVTARIANVGNLPAENVNASFEMLTGKFLEYYAQSDLGAEIEESLTDESEFLEFSFKTLLPNEIITLTFLLDFGMRPNAVIRSDRSIATYGITFPQPQDNTSLLNKFLGDYIFMLFIVLLMPLFYFYKYFKKITNSYSSSKNNVAFVLLHKGLVEKAESLLRQSVENGEDAPHSLANYSLCIALTEDSETAKSYLEAAEFYARTDHQKAVVLFNKALIEKLAGRNDLFYENLKSALKLSKKRIKDFCENSVHFEDIFNESDELRTVLENA